MPFRGSDAGRSSYLLRLARESHKQQGYSPVLFKPVCLSPQDLVAYCAYHSMSLLTFGLELNYRHSYCLLVSKLASCRSVIARTLHLVSVDKEDEDYFVADLDHTRKSPRGISDCLVLPPKSPGAKVVARTSKRKACLRQRRTIKHRIWYPRQ